MLQRNIQIRQNQPLGHEGNQLVHMGVRINIMQAHPGPHLAQGTGQFRHPGTQGTPLPEACSVPHIHPVGTGVLRNHQQLPNPGLDQMLGLLQHFPKRTADQIPTQGRNDAERAAMIAPLGNLEVGVMRRGQLDPLGRNQAGEGIMTLREVFVQRLHHPCLVMRSRNRQYLWVSSKNLACLGPQTAGHDDSPIFRQCFSDSVQRLLDGRFDEAAGIHHHHVRPPIISHHVVPFGPDLRQDPFGIHQRLGTAQRDKTDARYGRSGRLTIHHKRLLDGQWVPHQRRTLWPLW